MAWHEIGIKFFDNSIRNMYVYLDIRTDLVLTWQIFFSDYG